MALVTYPLNNIEYSAEDAELFHVTRTSGIYAKNSFDYSVTGADSNIVIGTGIGWIKNSEFSGKVIAQKEAISLDMGLPDSVYPRIDAIIIQFDSNRNETNIVVKKGTAASNPVAPSVVKNESVYELHLYHVRREAGSFYITSNNITDLRLNGYYCGLMTDSVTNIDTTAIEKQVSDLIKSLQDEISSVKDGSAYLPRDGSANMTGWLKFDGTVGPEWITADGTRFAVRAYKDGNLFQVTATPPGGSEIAAFNIRKDGGVYFGDAAAARSSLGITPANIGAASANLVDYTPYGAHDNIQTNLLHISLNMDDYCNTEGVVSTEDASTLVNSPVTSGAFYAYREVFLIDSTVGNNPKVTVRLTEAYPQPGRVWMNVYNPDVPVWSGWRYIDTADKFAPAGFGLGGAAQNVSSADEAVQSGFYQAPVFSEVSGSGQMFGYVSKTSDNWLTQVWHFVGKTFKRDKMNGVWQPLEWFDPPMMPGVEYRTTKRYHDAPVYTKKLSDVLVPAGQFVESATGVDHNHLISYKATMRNTNYAMAEMLPYHNYLGNLIGNVRQTANGIAIDNFDTEGFSSEIYIEYWK